MIKKRHVLSRAGLLLQTAVLLCGTALAQTVPLPLISSVSPSAVAPGAGNTTLTIIGANFGAPGWSFTSTVNFNGNVLSPAAVTVNTITVIVPSNLLTTPGTATIFISNAPATLASAAKTKPTILAFPSGVASNPAYFSIANPLTALTQTPGNSPTNSSGVAAASGDFNGDGVIDVAVGNSDGSVQVFLSDGAGNLNPAPGSFPTTAGPVSAMAVGDFNGDGIPDLAIASVTTSSTASAGTVTLYLGNGDGTFTVSSDPNASVMLAAPATAMAVADFGADGRLDLAVVEGGTPGSFQPLNGNGTGGLIAGVAVTVGNNPAAVSIGDFNDDGFPDVVVANSADSTATVLIYQLPVASGNAVPNLIAASSPFVVSSTPAVGNTPTGVVVGDFNGDGFLDFVTANHGDGSYTFLPGSGNGVFGAASGLVAKAKSTAKSATSKARSASSPAFPPSGGISTSIAVGDFNADGIPDIALYDGANLAVYLGDGSGNFNYLSEIATTDGPQFNFLAAGDLNGDGYLDLIAGFYQSVAPILTVPPTFSVPSNLSVGSANIGSSATQNLVLSNATSSSVTVTSLGFTGANSTDFSATNTCATVNANSNCTLVITFKPNVAGPESATLTVTDSAGTQTVNLTGTGVGVPLAQVVSSYPVGSATVGSSTTSTLNIGNTGTGPLVVASASVTGPFTVSNNCNAATVAPGASCTVTLTFTPTAVGPATGMLTFTDNSGGTGGSIQQVNLSAVGNGAVAGLSSTTLSFGNQNDGTTSAAQTLTIQNTGNQPLTISGVTTAAPFAVSANTCTTGVAAGSSCTISVTFSPTTPGAATGTLTFTDNSVVGGTSASVNLSGTGVATSGAKATVTPTSLSFLGVVGTASAPQTVTLKNTGTSALSITSIAATGEFLVSSKTCTTTLAVNATCTVSVEFRPTAPGAATGTLTFTDNSVSSATQVVQLSGTIQAPIASVSPASLSFAGEVGTVSAPQTVTLKNTGTATLSISSIAATGEFIVAGRTCGTTLAAGASCTVSVEFRPTAAGAATGTLTFTDNGSTSTSQVVQLSGTVQVATASVSPTSLTFGSVAISGTSAAQPVTLSNTGTGPLAINSINLTGNFVSTASTCNRSLAAGASCTVSVAFSPRSAGALTGTLVFGDNSSTGASQTVQLKGTGVNIRLSANPGTLVFTSRAGAKSAAQTVTISNPGAQLVNISSMALAGTNSSDFAIASNTCGATLAVGATCKVGITFTGPKAGEYTAQLNVVSNAPELSVQLIGLVF